jgi:ABC-type nitrate/sulfonate/bicarbonate transport system permease component
MVRADATRHPLGRLWCPMLVLLQIWKFLCGACKLTLTLLPLPSRVAMPCTLRWAKGHMQIFLSHVSGVSFVRLNL